MGRLVKKILPLILSLSVIILVITKVPAPESWQKASLYQLISFILPVLFFWLLLVRIFIRNLAANFLVGFYLLLLFVLKITGLLNFLTGLLFTCAFAFLLTLFGKYSLTTRKKAPTLKPIKSRVYE